MVRAVSRGGRTKTLHAPNPICVKVGSPMSQTNVVFAPEENYISKAAHIERRKASDLPYETFLRDYVRMNRPVVIEQSVPQWKAIIEWTPSFFAERFGTENVGVTFGVQMPMAELIQKIVAS